MSHQVSTKVYTHKINRYQGDPIMITSDQYQAFQNLSKQIKEGGFNPKGLISCKGVDIKWSSIESIDEILDVQRMREARERYGKLNRYCFECNLKTEKTICPYCQDTTVDYED